MKNTTNKNYGYLPSSPQRSQASMIILLLLLLLAFFARAQEGSQGNTTIFAGAQATVFGNYNFATGGGGTQPGIVGTERTTSAIGTGFGVLNFSAPTLTVTGADDANHIDGYVHNLGAGLFVYPVGDNGFFGPFAATGAGTTGAYFHTDPTTAVTSNLAGGDYPVLPAGGPFPVTSKATTLGAVSTVEYWDIDGANTSSITLTWDAGSNVATLTGNVLSNLMIVGWNPVTSQWEKIPSTVDATSVLGGASTLAAGSITTNANLVPSNFTVYTLGVQVPDLTPTADFDDLNFTSGQTRDFIINIFEILDVPTNPTAPVAVSFRLTRISGWDITVPGITLSATDQSGIAGTSNVFGGTPHENDRWLFKQNSGFITITLKPGNGIAAAGIAKLGFIATRKPGTITGTTQNITATIINGSGGEVNFNNNRSITNISAN